MFKNIKWKTCLSLGQVPLIHSLSVFLQRIPDNKCCGTIYQKMRRQRMLKEEYIENQIFNTLCILSWMYGDLLSASQKNSIQNLYYRMTWRRHKEENLRPDSICGESTLIYGLIARSISGLACFNWDVLYLELGCFIWNFSAFADIFFCLISFLSKCLPCCQIFFSKFSVVFMLLHFVNHNVLSNHLRTSFIFSVTTVDCLHSLRGNKENKWAKTYSNQPCLTFWIVHRATE